MEIKKLQFINMPNYFKFYLYILINTFFRMTGTVKFFNDSKGFGFITNEEEGKKGVVAANVQVL